MQANSNIQCNDPLFISYRNRAIVPLLIFWGLLMPALILYILFRNRKCLQVQNVRIVFGSLINEYKDGYYYWGVVLILMKEILLLIVDVLSLDNSFQLTMIFCFFFVYCLVLQRINPYNKDQIAKLEYKYMNCLMLTTLMISLSTTSTNDKVRTTGVVILCILNILMGLSYAWIFVKMFSKTKAQVTSNIKMYLSKRRKKREPPVACIEFDTQKKDEQWAIEENKRSQSESPMRGLEHPSSELQSPIEGLKNPSIELQSPIRSLNSPNNENGSPWHSKIKEDLQDLSLAGSEDFDIPNPIQELYAAEKNEKDLIESSNKNTINRIDSIKKESIKKKIDSAVDMYRDQEGEDRDHERININISDQ